jgi:hypothetical protein
MDLGGNSGRNFLVAPGSPPLGTGKSKTGAKEKPLSPVKKNWWFSQGYFEGGL